MTSGLTQAGVISVDWNRLLQADPAAAGSPLLRELLKATTPPAQRETEWVIALRACAPADRLDFVRSAIAQTLASVLRLANPQSISPTQSVFDMGLDSILALELTNRLASGFGTSLRATLLFTHSTLDALASFVLSKVLPAQSEVMALEASSELTEAELSRLIALEISSR
jgi:acyl carrier protein